MGEKHIQDIISGDGQFKVVANDRGINFLEKFLPDGRGVRLQMDGAFKGFIDPKNSLTPNLHLK